MPYTIWDALEEVGSPADSASGTQQIKCPIHAGGGEKHRSARVYSDTDSVYCFTCGKSWNAIALLAAANEWSYGRAKAYVQEKTGEVSSTTLERRADRASSSIANAIAAIRCVGDEHRRLEMLAEFDSVLVAAAQGETDHEVAAQCSAFLRKHFPALAP